LPKRKYGKFKMKKKCHMGQQLAVGLAKYGKLYGLRKCRTSASVGFVTRRVRAVREVVGPTVYE